MNHRTDDDLVRLVEAAGCSPEKSARCAALVAGAIRDATKVYRSRTKPRRGTIQRIERLQRAYRKLRAGREGEMALAVLQTLPRWHEFNLAGVLADLDRAKRITGRIMKRAGAPKGARDKPGLDWLLLRLWGATAGCGFTWTAYKRRDGSAKGTLVDLLRAVNLPDEMIPDSDATLLKAISRAKKGASLTPRIPNEK